MKVRRWTPAEDEALRQGRASGKTNAEIAAELGRTYQAVKARMGTIGLTVSMPVADRPWSEEEVARLAEMRAAGASTAEIATALGRTRDSIAQAASKRSIARPRFRDVAERFWEKVDRGGPDECWEWQGARDRKGYGAFALTNPKRRATASRVAWELANGPIPDGHAVCHRCDNPPCVNPAHLFIGSNEQNIADRVAKGRENTGTFRHRAPRHVRTA